MDGGSLGINAVPQLGEGDGLAGHGFVPALAKAFFSTFEGDAFAEEPDNLQQIGQVLRGRLLDLLHYGIKHDVGGGHGGPGVARFEQRTPFSVALAESGHGRVGTAHQWREGAIAPM